MKNILKAWLKKNELTPDPNDNIAIILSMGSINKKGLISAMKEDGIELSSETIDDVVTRYHRYSAKYAARGWNVDNGLVYLRPVITGAVHGKTFNPEKNRIYISATQGLEIRNELLNTEVEILGERPDIMQIYHVINLQTKAEDGTLTRGRNAQVEGTYIKIVGDNPLAGVSLYNLTSGVETQLYPEYVVTNEPSKLMLLIPAELEPGQYRLKVVTQFTSGKIMLKAPRETVFSQELTVI